MRFFGLIVALCFLALAEALPPTTRLPTNVSLSTTTPEPLVPTGGPLTRMVRTELLVWIGKWIGIAAAIIIGLTIVGTAIKYLYDFTTRRKAPPRETVEIAVEGDVECKTNDHYVQSNQAAEV